MAGAETQVEPRVIRRRRRAQKPVVPHGGAWKVAYADFVTAMMAFFMLMWLLANADKGRLKGLADYFSTTTTGAPSGVSNLIGDDPGQGGRRAKAQGDNPEASGKPTEPAGSSGAASGGTANIPEATQRVMADEMRLALEPATDTPRTTAVHVSSSREGLRINLMDSSRHSLFAGASATLNAHGRTLLMRLARKLTETEVRISIEGHTDASGGEQSQANWALSSARALAARDAMLAAGLPPHRFADLVAKAGTEPVYPDAPARPENRRITVVVLGEASVLPRDVGFRF